MPTLPLGEPWVFLPFFFMFFTIYLFGYFIFFRKRSPEFRFESCSCLICIFHGAPAIILGAVAFFADPDHAFAYIFDRNLMATNTVLQNTVLDFSTAFLVADLLLHYAATFSGAATDKLLYKRHVSTLFLIVTCRHLVLHGAFAVLVLLFLAEVSSMWQSVWILAGVRRRKDFFSARVYRRFKWLRSSVSGMSPIFVAFWIRPVYNGGAPRGPCPENVKMCWLFIWTIAIYANILAIYACWKHVPVKGEKVIPKEQQQVI